jgi:hypothetical protein
MAQAQPAQKTQRAASQQLAATYQTVTTTGWSPTPYFTLGFCHQLRKYFILIFVKYNLYGISMKKRLQIKFMKFKK